MKSASSHLIFLNIPTSIHPLVHSLVGVSGAPGPSLVSVSGALKYPQSPGFVSPDSDVQDERL